MIVLDPLYRVREITTKLPGVAPVSAPDRFDSTVAYQYDLGNNRTRSFVSINGSEELSTTYQFDTLNRATLVRQLDPANSKGSGVTRMTKNGSRQSRSPR